jgi:hypothetical protein
MDPAQLLDLDKLVGSLFADYDSEVDRLKELRRTKPEKRTKEQKTEIEKLYASIKTEERRQERLQTQEAVKVFHRGMEVHLTDLLLTDEQKYLQN